MVNRSGACVHCPDNRFPCHTMYDPQANMGQTVVFTCYGDSME